jgi:hypothetical protein
VQADEPQGTHRGCGGKVRGNACKGCGADYLAPGDIDPVGGDQTFAHIYAAAAAAEAARRAYDLGGLAGNGDDL